FDGQPTSVLRDGAEVASYLYDEAGGRIRRTAGGVTTRYAGEYQDDGTTAITRYPGVGLKAGGELYFTVADPAGTTSVLLDASGNAVQWTEYEPFGALRQNDVFDPASGDGITPHRTDYLYNGKERDTVFDGAADIYDYGPRMYLADVGRWLSPDPTFADGVNRYAYAVNDPVNFADPSGQSSVP